MELWGAHFLEKFLVETQSVIDWCSFGKKTILPHLKHKAGYPLHLLNHVACSVTLWPCPAEFSCSGGSGCSIELGLTEDLLGRLLSGNQRSGFWIVWVHHGGHLYLPCEPSPYNSRKRKRCSPPASYRLVSNTPVGDCLDLPSQMPVVLIGAELSYFHGLNGVLLGAETFRVCLPQATVWGQDEMLGYLLWG